MDSLRQIGIPIDEIELGIKFTVQTAVVVIGTVGNLYTIYSVATRSRLPKATNIFIVSLSVALMLQAGNAAIDYAYHLSMRDEYLWGYAACDTWNTLNVYLPMLLALHCFFCLLDRFIVLAHPDMHTRIMNPWTVMVMLLISYIVPILFAVPPIYFEWYAKESYLKWRTDNECKFRTNMVYAMISPIFTFWIPVIFDASIIIKIFKAMEQHDRAVAILTVSSCEKREKLREESHMFQLPWKDGELRRQHRLAITLWSVYWNVSLFWIPHFAWLFIYKITDADWPRATNFMAWMGYMPCFIVPGLCRYYNIYSL